MSADFSPRVWNFTPHALHIYFEGVTEPLTIPSDGDLRLLSVPDPEVQHVPSAGAIPVVPAQIFMDLDPSSAAYPLLQQLKPEDSVIVSMPVAHWLVTSKKDAVPCPVFSPGTGPASVVRYGDEDPARKGQIKGVRALEYHRPRYLY